jgi:S-adenosylmethionine:tRNA ribosyltransferase-isomerase
MAERRHTTDDFDYPLPDELIAQVPSPERGASRMLLMDRTQPTFADRHFSELLS